MPRHTHPPLLLAGLLALVTALPGGAAASAAPPPAPPAPAPAPAPALFSDVPPGHWAAPAVGALFLAGVVQGDEQGRFRPEDPVSRSEMVKMVLAARGIPVAGECAGRFQDVPCTAWFARAVEMGYRLALVEGLDEARFAPLAAVRREEAFTILVRAMGKGWEARHLSAGEVRTRLAPFADGARLSPWARGPTAWLLAHGYLSGTATGNLQPQAATTRAEVAVLLQRTLLPMARQRQVAMVDGYPLRFARAMDAVATKYATGEPGVGIWTYTSLRVREGVVAVDPGVIPLGSLLYVPGYGYSVAADIGGAIKGNRIDLYTDDYHEAAHVMGPTPMRIYLLD